MKYVLFQIAPSRRVANSPFSVEGTNVSFDITESFSVPCETTIMVEDTGGNITPKVLRYIPTCNTLDKEEQLKRGFPAIYRLPPSERWRLTFRDGKLFVESTDTIRLEFFRSTGWFEGLAPKFRYPNTQIIYQEIDENKELDVQAKFEDLVTDARLLIRNIKLPEAKAMLLARDRNIAFSDQYQISWYKNQLNEIANTEPDWILGVSKSDQAKVTVILSKAESFELLDLQTPGKIRMKTGEDKWEDVGDLADIGGSRRKFERAVEWFQNRENQLFREELEKLVIAKEEAAAGQL